MTGSAILHRQTGTTLPRLGNARGLWVTDSEGREYLDAVSGGAAVSAIGHGDPTVREAILAQLDRVAYAHSSFFTSDPAEDLAETLVASAPDGIAKVAFCSGGSEAVEGALKLARQYWVERGQPQKSRIIARRQSYHGATLGALSVGGNPARRALYAPLLFDAEFIAPCYAYRDQRPGESEADYGLRAARDLEDTILRLGAENVAAFIAEPVVGATLGCAPAVPGYLREIRRICDAHDVLLILDEIMCGAGRTGHGHACLEDGVAPDLMTMAKGLGGGYLPIGAVLIGGQIADAIAAGSGRLGHGLTYMGHPVACAGALAVQRVIAGEGLVERAALRGAALRARLEARFGQHPHVGDIRGRGLFLGLELVQDRETKTPFDPARSLHAVVKRTAMTRGLMIYPSGGTVDGAQGDHILLAPALTVSEAELDEIVARLALALDDALEEIA
ncbi:Adenosylmethionine-8-amino-7-oxononanoate aminotransferase [Roseovarius pacificus]|uniref:Adenosylmethionine-8-amino-7-oxononanoate aminotransferase n=1 Tax=Roseovarius pacificus TaxID=337701 RepID=A0A1M6Y7M5_9RHOB|nr:aspartate aminotransferase family protein [Roseovarius pacificus]GGO51228.1 adenosylmethionine-8-amino-7-oxononanoate aminotransferase [Roseovarius pacificus]SHL14284.1 Adenosylmethionine-8-amino-7-oxononanoate aminotransferase [Roseovarius pacificus]